jgi:radical SAM protein with 4Fe4S-binding SPASM domain
VIVPDARVFERPYVVSWNLTYRCNLACEHCYLDAGGSPLVEDAAFADRSELSTDECFRVADQISALAPETVTILTGGEPLLRRDILEIVRYASGKGLWVVIGTNGVKVTATLAARLRAEGARGLALSLDALDPERHDAFRKVRGAWRNTVDGASILHDAGFPFIVQTTVGAHNVDELPGIAAFAHAALRASVWNLYFLVPTGRGAFVSDIAPERYDGVLSDLARIQARYSGSMVVNAKCAPHFIRTVLDRDPGSPALKAYDGGAGGCPAGTHYLGIRPNGDVTPCPYLPLFGGNLRSEPLAAIWESSDLFVKIRRRDTLGGRCGACELQGLCGGCRARAYGATGDVMAEDPLCTHVPGSRNEALARITGNVLEYGRKPIATIAWDPEANERMKRIPAFVRGMVVRAVEAHCAKLGVARVTVPLLDEIRSKMPASRVFSGRGR